METDLGEIVSATRTQEWLSWLIRVGEKIVASPDDFSTDVVKYFQRFSSPRSGRPDVGSGMRVVTTNRHFTLLGLERDVVDNPAARFAYAGIVRLAIAAREIALGVRRKGLEDASLLTLDELGRKHLPQLTTGIRSSNTGLGPALSAIGALPELSPLALRQFANRLSRIKTNNQRDPLGQSPNPNFIRQLINIATSMRQAWVLLAIQVDPSSIPREFRFTPFDGWDGADKGPTRLDIFLPTSATPQRAPVVTLPDTPSPTADDPGIQHVPSTRSEESWTRMVSSAFRNHRANFPYAWSNLNPIELAKIDEQLAAAKRSTSDEKVAKACALQHLLTIGRTAVAENDSPPGAASRTVQIVQPPSAFVPRPAVSDLYEPVGSPLSMSIRSPEKFDTKQLGGRWPTGLFKQDRRIRVSESRLNTQFYSDVLKHLKDPVLTRKLRAHPADSRPDDYYSAFYADDLNHAFPELEFTLPGAAAFGAQGVPDIQTLQHKIASIKQEIAALQQSRDGTMLWRLHNLYVVYNLLCWELSSTHRLVNDPFYSSQTIFPNLGLVLTSDKAATRSHSVRFGLWTPLAELQRCEYDEHLRVLLLLAKNRSPELFAEIEQALAGQNSALPYLFFVLNKRVVQVSHRSVRLVADDLWPYQDAALRSAFATHGRRTIEPEIVDALLGHWEEDQAPFSKFSASAWPQFNAVAAPKIDEFACQLGFELTAGLQSAMFDPDSAENELVDIKIKPRKLGPQKREEIRAARKNNDKVVVASAIKYLREEIEANPVSELLTEAAEHAKRYICNSKGSGRDIERRLKILNRYLRRLRVRKDKSVAVPITGLAMAPRSSRPVVTDFSGKKLRAFIQLREQLTPWLEVTLKKKISNDKLRIERRACMAAASCVVSAVVYGGLSKQHVDKFISAMLEGRHFRFQGLDWLESTDAGAQVFRFVGDATSRAVLALTAPDGPFSGAVQKLATRDVKRQAASILQELLNVPEDALEHVGLGKVNLEAVANLGEEYFPTVLPGVLAAYLRGDLATRSLALEPFLRVISGGAIVRPLQWQHTTKAKRRYRPTFKSSLEVSQQKQLAAELVSILRWREYEHDLPSDEVRRAGSPQQLKKLRKTHRRLQNQLYREHVTPLLTTFNEKLTKHGCWPIVWLLTCHARELVQHGGEKSKILNGDTVVDYISTNATDLVLAFGPQDPLEMDEDERQQCYVDSLPKAASPEGKDPKKYRKRCLIRLSTFDKFLMRDYGVPPINWEGISAGMASGLDFVHANLVTPQDFARLVDRLEEHDDALNVSSYFCGVKMYDVGFRNGEAERAPSGDHLFSKDGAIFYARTVKGAKPKTPNGTRQASVDKAAAKRIEAAYEKVVQLLGSEVTNNANFSLVNSPAGHRGLNVSRDEWATHLHRALMEVTGDHHIRTYSLRHGHATRSTLLALKVPHPLMAKMAGFDDIESYQNACDELRMRLTNTELASPRLLDAIAMHLGQSGFEVTAHSYLHTFELMAACALDEITPALNMKALAEFTNVPHSNVRQTSSRLHKKNPQAKRYELIASLNRENLSPYGCDFPSISVRVAQRAEPTSIESIYELDFMRFANLLIDMASGEFESLPQRYNVQPNEIEALEPIVLKSLILNTFQPLDGPKNKELVIRGLQRIEERLPIAIERIFDNVGKPWLDDMLILSPTFLTADDALLKFRSANLRDYVNTLFEHLLNHNFDDIMQKAHKEIGTMRRFTSDRLRADEKRLPLASPDIVLGEHSTRSKRKKKGKSAPLLGFSKPVRVGIRNWKLLIWMSAIRRELGREVQRHQK
ncbi:MAG: hypothetical protein EVA65_05630 [Oceanococcus sp.]|nr:MAG: hypothetical protein EVA65_05630 [Oceanococcus sp.]